MARLFGNVSTDSIVTKLTAHGTRRSYAMKFYRTGNGGGNNGRMFDKRTGSDVQVEALFENDLSRLIYSRVWTSGSVDFYVASPSNDAWHTVVVTYDSSSPSNYPVIYVDGVSQSVTRIGSAPTGSALTSTSPYVIGNRTNDNGRNWAGRLAEFAIWDRILTAEESVAICNGASPLHFRQSLLEYVPLIRDLLSRIIGPNPPVATGTSVVDHPRVFYPKNYFSTLPPTTPEGVTKSLQYTVTITPSAKTKSLAYTVKQAPSAKTKSLQYCVKVTRQNKGVYFDGVDDYIEIPDSNELSPANTGAFAVGIKIRPEVLEFLISSASSDGEYVHLAGKSEYGSPNTVEWVIRIYSKSSPLRSNRISFYVFNSTGGTGVGSYFQDEIRPNECITIMGAIDATHTYIWKNGVLRDSDNYATFPIVPANTSAPVRLGRVENGGDPGYFQGSMDDFIIFNRKLSDAEALAYHQGNPPSDYVARYLFDDGDLSVAKDETGNHNGVLHNGVVYVDGLALMPNIKQMRYVVKSTPSATKSLQYAVKRTPSAITKGLIYDVKTTPSAKTKGLIYDVKQTPAAKTESLQYAVKRTPSAITKSLTYGVGWRKYTYTFADFATKQSKWGKIGGGGTLSFPNVGSPYNDVIRLVNPAGSSIEVHRNLKPSYGSNFFKGFTSIEMDINVHGSTIIGGDASAFGFDQAGWKYISLSSYITNGYDGWQHISIPMTALVTAGLNVNAVSTFLVLRIWNAAAVTVDIDNIKFVGHDYYNFSQPEIPAVTGNHQWAFQSADTMKWSKDTVAAQKSQSQINALAAKDYALGLTHWAIDVPYDLYSAYSPAVTAGYKDKFILAARNLGLKVWHRAHFNEWEGDYGFMKTTPRTTPSRALGSSTENVLNGVDTTSWLYLHYHYIKTHSSEFEAGDIFSPIAEIENAGYANGTTDQFSNRQEMWEFIRNLQTVCTEAFKEIGLEEEVFVGFWGHSGYTALNAIDEFTAESEGILATDHYVFSAATMSSDLDSMENYFPEVPVVIGEWGNYVESSAALNAQNLRDIFDVFVSKGANLIGVNYWDDIGGSYESLMDSSYTERLNYWALREYFSGIFIESPTKSLRYAVKAPVAQTKSLKYVVTITPSAKTKSSQYAVRRGNSSTKGLLYKIKAPVGATKSLKYEVTISGAVTKSLTYAVYTSQPAVTKSLKYEVTIQGAITKSLVYMMPAIKVKTKSLIYMVDLTEAAIQKSLRYKVAVPHSVTKSMRYVMRVYPYRKKNSPYTKISRVV